MPEMHDVLVKSKIVCKFIAVTIHLLHAAFFLRCFEQFFLLVRDLYEQWPEFVYGLFVSRL